MRLSVWGASSPRKGQCPPTESSKVRTFFQPDRADSRHAMKGVSYVRRSFLFRPIPTSATTRNWRRISSRPAGRSRGAAHMGEAIRCADQIERVETRTSDRRRSASSPTRSSSSPARTALRAGRSSRGMSTSCSTPARRIRNSSRPRMRSSPATSPRFAGCSMRRPELIRQRSSREHRSTLLHYVSANGIEDFRQRTPPNIVDDHAAAARCRR